jgi:hypothetical protein
MVEGMVTKIGYPYKPGDQKKGHLRYVEITDSQSRMRFRYFYVNPEVAVGHFVEKEQPIGEVQDLTKIFRGITSHFHLEIIDYDGRYIDPKDVMDMVGMSVWP